MKLFSQYMDGGGLKKKGKTSLWQLSYILEFPVCLEMRYSVAAKCQQKLSPLCIALPKLSACVSGSQLLGCWAPLYKTAWANGPMAETLFQFLTGIY